MSFIFLPVQYTKRHYLNVGAVLSSMLLDLGFLFPLGLKLDVCYDEITPNDMTSDVTCAISGAMVIFGSWAIVLWGLARSFLLHVQVCWGRDLEPKIKTITVIIAWFVPGIGLIGAMAASGVSYRMGKTCLLNPNHDLSLWAPILAVSVVALILQLATMVYSSYVYLRSSKQDGYVRNRSALPSSSTEVLPSSSQLLIERMKKLFSLQWRGIINGLHTVTNVLFFAIVFWSLDHAQRAQKDPLSMWDWVVCIIDTQGDKNACISKANEHVPPQNELYAVLGFLIGIGTCCIVTLFRLSMVQGWCHLITGKVQRYPEDVLLDERRRTFQRQGYQVAGDSFREINVSTSTYLGHSDLEDPPPVYKQSIKDDRV
ncbi:hypothetical protein KEM56_003446 [Ascosphaera pollenicola]|nr:hypothetical protein KEM56_003446 [Ascosphaera pollenicola]